MSDGKCGVCGADHECTSWIVAPTLTGGRTMFLHKNRDSASASLALARSAAPGKYAWISICDRGKTAANAGLNEKGVAVAMNSGDLSDRYRLASGLSTPEIARRALESSATAEAAVRVIEKMIRDGEYTHGKRGSIWFVADARKAFIIENDALRIARHEVKADFAIRANAWHFPEMLAYSQLSPRALVANARREFAVRQSLFEKGTLYREPVTQEKIAAASRISVLPESPACCPVCGKRTNSATTIAIDCEYPEILSTFCGAFGPPRYALYLPIPFLADELPAELTGGAFFDAAFARRAARRELLPEAELVGFERKLFARHDRAVDRARQLLRDGGAGGSAKDILTAAFRLNWNAVRKLCAGK